MYNSSSRALAERGHDRSNDVCLKQLSNQSKMISLGHCSQHTVNTSTYDCLFVELPQTVLLRIFAPSSLYNVYIIMKC